MVRSRTQTPTTPTTTKTPTTNGETDNAVVFKTKSNDDNNNHDNDTTSPKSQKISTTSPSIEGGSTSTTSPSGEEGVGGRRRIENENDTTGDDGPNNVEEPNTSTYNNEDNNNNNEDNNSNEEQGESSSPEEAAAEGEEDVPEKKIKLYKSPRFKGYLTIALASIISYEAARISQNPTKVTVVPASDEQKIYAQCVAMVSVLVSGSSVLCHLDAYSCMSGKWRQLFAPQSKFEVVLLILLLLWWAVATIIQTSVRGIAGDGKEQYNLYYSIWCCLCVSVLTLESKMTEYGWPKIKVFVKSWPHRAPGWISIFGFDFFTLFWYVDLYINSAQNEDRVHDELVEVYKDIPTSQYEWLMFVASVTLLPAMAFIFIEIFRDSSITEKPSVESYAEGVCLLVLTFAWIPSVIVATTPGGFASVIGNSYFFTWATTIFVIETAMWFVHDSRWQVHQALVQKEQEYRRHQQKVLEQTLQIRAQEGAKTLVTAQEGAIEDDNNPTEEDGNNEEEEWPQLASTDRGRRGMLGDDSANGLMGGETDSMDDGGDHMAFRDINQLGGATPGFVLDSAADEHYDNPDDSIRQEMRMKEANRDAYFDTLYDILE